MSVSMQGVVRKRKAKTRPKAMQTKREQEEEIDFREKTMMKRQ